MPSFESEEDGLVASALDSWQESATNQVDDIGGWRDSHWLKRFPQSRYGGNGEPKFLFLHTTTIVSWLARKFPKLDPAPIQQVYAAINAWYTDWNADRIPPQNELESILSQAIILLTCVWNEIYSRTIRGAPVILPNEDRDKWLYEQACEGIAWSTIASRLAKKKSWEPLCLTGVRNAANRYQNRNKNLPRIPKRQHGRKAR